MAEPEWRTTTPEIEATGRTTTPLDSTAEPGGATRSTWPTSITSGLLTLFQRARSRQA